MCLWTRLTGLHRCNVFSLPTPSLPTDVCTVVSDPTCQVSKSVVCDPITVTDECLLTIRRAFEEPGTYCVNITLVDDTSQALVSALVSVNGGESTQSRCRLAVNSFSLWLFPCRVDEHRNLYGVFIMPGGLIWDCTSLREGPCKDKEIIISLQEF